MSRSPARRSIVIPRTTLFFVLLSLAVVLFAPGCAKSSSSETVVATTTVLSISSEHDGFTGTETYGWDTNTTAARLEIRIRGFHRGNLRVRVLDALGTEVYDNQYWYWDALYAIGSDEYLDISFAGNGQPGLWTVLLEFGEFSGHLYLTLEEPSGGQETVIDVTSASSGVVDPTFGIGGRATVTEFRSYGLDSVNDGANRLVVVGTTIDTIGNRRLAVWRFFSDGAFDVNFGNSGVAIFDDGFPSSGRGVTIDGAGRILVTGWVANAAGNLDMILLRLTSGGLLDGSFALGGTVTFDQPGFDDVGSDIAVDSAGRTVIAGNSRDFSTNIGNVFCKRYLQGGAPDITFGTVGTVVTANPTDRCAGMVLDLDRPTLVGERDGDLALWRFTNSGVPDTTFGTAGVVGGIVQPGEVRYGLGLTIRSTDGAIAACGFRGIGTADWELAVWRYANSGVADTNFSGDGFEAYTFPGGEAIGTDLLFDGSDRLLVLGVTRTSGVTTGDDASATLWRFLGTGALDATFGSGGVEAFDRRSTPGVVTAAADLEPAGAASAYAVGAAVDLESGSADLTIWRLIP